MRRSWSRPRAALRATFGAACPLASGCPRFPHRTPGFKLATEG
jgi:hypothetical protein